MKLNFFKKNLPKKTDQQPVSLPSDAFGQKSSSITSIRDLLSPSAIEVDFDYLKINNRFFRTLFVAGYPRFVSANWLAPLINFEHSMEVSMFIYPLEGKTVLDDLRRKIAEMEAEINMNLQKGVLVNPATQAKLEDAQTVQEELVKGIERFFQFGLYVTIPADNLEELDYISKQVESTLGSLLIITKHSTLQMEEGFESTLPICQDNLMISRNMDTTSLATTFPFTSSELTANEGILYGINEHNDSLIIFDRFTLENANAVIFAKSGAGKSLCGSDEVLFNDGSSTKLGKIGSLVENLISKYGSQPIIEGIEGVINPNLKVWTFDSSLKGRWSKVSVAARKKFSPRNRLYLITTKSGRQITVTADHNLVILRKGKIRVMRSEAIEIGEAVPLPRSIKKPINCPLTINPSEFVPLWPSNLPYQIPLEKELLNLLGLTTSEGFINQKFLRIFNIDKQVLDIIEKSLVFLKAKYFKINSRNKWIGFSVSSYYAKLFISLGAGGKSGEKRIPPLIFSLSNKQIVYYLQAYFEGDGGIESHEVSATTKSKDLASDLAYILMRFGIIARIRTHQKAATNTVKKTKNVYYQVVISGKENLVKFATNIGFLTESKNLKLRKLLEKSKVANTNVDTIPTLQPIFNYLYKSLFSSSEISSPLNLSPLKRGIFSPSPQQLKEFINDCEKRLTELHSLRNQIQLLRSLPSLKSIIERGSKNRKLNRQLWQTLGQSWRIMKNCLCPPFAKNVLLAYQTISGRVITLPELNSALYNSFKHQGVSLLEYDNSVWSALAIRKTGNSNYSNILKAAKFICRKYRSTQLKIRYAEEKIKQLKILAISELFWDPIVKIERINHKEKYVYDLQVDTGVFLAGHGGMFVHNSYLVKLEALRSLMFGTEILVIDPENEYQALCEAVGGEVISFGFNSPKKINPFDLAQIYTEGENELGLKLLSLHSLFKVIMGELDSSQEAVLDRALVLTYKMKGITPDPATQNKEPPLMEDLYKSLLGMEEPQAKILADKIEKFIKGSFMGIFNQKSNVDIKNPFTVFSIRDLEETLRPIAMYIILDFIWTKIRRELKKRILIVDEAWYLMKYPDSANFINSIAKRARKYYLGLTTLSQNVEDFLNTDLGKAIITNSSIQILLKQHPAAIDKIAQVFYLSEGERQLLLSAEVGEGLFFAGNNHVAIKVIASAEENNLVTTSPKELLIKKAQAQAQINQTQIPPEIKPTENIPPLPKPQPIKIETEVVKENE